MHSKLLRFLRSKSNNSHNRSFSLAKWARKAKEGDAIIICDLVPVVMWLLGAFHKGMVDSYQYPWHSYVYGGDLDDYAVRLLDFVKALKHLKVKPVFFVEGPMGSHRSETTNKMESRMRKRQKREVLADGYVKYCQDERGSRSLEHHLELKPLLLLHLLQELYRNGAEVIICNGETERPMVQYAKEHPSYCGILTTNTNLTLLGGCRVLHCKLFDCGEALQLQQKSLNKQPQDVLCETLEPNDLARTLGIDVQCLPALSILCGNDYSSQYLKQQEVIDELKLTKPYDVESVCRWIRDHECRTVHQFLTNPEISEICDIVPDFSDAVEHTYNFDDESLEDLDDSSSENTICPQSAALRERVLTKNLDIEFLPIINCGIFYHNPLDCEGSTDVYTKLCRVRKWMYSLLCVRNVTEYSLSSRHNKFCDIPSCDPTLLKEFCGLTIQQRMLTLFSVLTHVDEPLQKFLPQDLYDSALRRDPSSVLELEHLFRYACLVSGFRMGIIPDDAITPLMMTCLCSGLGLHSPRLRNKPIPNSAIVNCALQFSCLMEHAYNLASLLGLNSQLSPPSKMFKASLFVPLQMMSLKEQGPNDIDDTPMAVANEKLLSFYTRVTKAFSAGNVMEQFHETIRRGDEGSIPEFITLFATAQGALKAKGLVH